MHTIMETPTFVRDAAKWLSEDELAELLTHVAFHPTSGDVIPGSGGFRKLRWARQGKGKSSGVRTIYFFYDGNYPITMVALYAKNERSNLTKAEVNGLADMAKELKAIWRQQ